MSLSDVSLTGIGDPAMIWVCLETLLERPAWQERALCRGVGHEVFFPDRGGSTAPAKALCEACPVSAQCESYAEDTGSGGIWAGKGRKPRYVGLVVSSGRAERPPPREQ